MVSFETQQTREVVVARKMGACAGAHTDRHTDRWRVRAQESDIP